MYIYIFIYIYMYTYIYKYIYLSVHIYRKQYLHILSYILHGIKQENTEVDTDALFNVNQYHSVKIAVEFIILIGIKPFLLPGIGINIDKLCSIAFTIVQETNLNCLEVKYHVIYVLYNLIIFLLYTNFTF